MIYYPIIILSILLFISSRHSHYSLIIYPNIAFLAGSAFEYLFHKERVNLRTYKYVVGFTFTLIGSISLFLCLASLTENKLLTFAFTDIGLIYLIPLSFCYIIFGLVVFIRQFTTYSFAKLFIIILIVQMITLANLYGIGLMGNPNSEFKSFIRESKISNNFST